ncbi:MerR family transcriptional regulator [Bacillus sp. FJAT-42376]|uniref:MerR family transcriptional regulator n=1 Tax=Bacillus sp. FJAT-42376 TaxID=2014076 RepID=UPI000F4F4C15|nr:MerR family transcriptional regulator [Bacillus sp. FJAT-42376]AZB41311.1 MerR family transcriptional regulator [Bacillus sp. FJAT-42376]
MGLTIKEASEKTGMSTHTIRFYEKEGLLPFLKRDQAGYRIFTDHDLEWLDFISCLRVTDIPLSELKRIVELTEEGIHTIPERKNVLLEHKEKLIAKQEELDRAFKKIEVKMKYFDHLEKNAKIH